MNITLVKNREDYVHHEYSQPHQQCKTCHCAGERLCLTNQFTSNPRRNDFIRCFGDEVGCVSKCDTGFKVEEQCHTRELIQVIHCLGTKCCSPRYKFTKLDQTLAVIGSNVQLREIFRMSSSLISNLENYLILIFRFLDQVQIILRVSITQQSQDSRFRDTVSLCLFATEVDVYVWCVAEVVRRDRQKTGISH